MAIDLNFESSGLSRLNEADESAVMGLETRFGELRSSIYVAAHGRHCEGDIESIVSAGPDSYRDGNQHEIEERIAEIVPEFSETPQMLPYSNGVFFNGTILPYMRFDDSDAGLEAMHKIYKACDVSAGSGMLPTRYRLAGPEDSVFSPYNVTLVFETDSHSPSKLLEIGAFLIAQEMEATEDDQTDATIYPFVRKEADPVLFDGAVAGN